MEWDNAINTFCEYVREQKPALVKPIIDDLKALGLNDANIKTLGGKGWIRQNGCIEAAGWEYAMKNDTAKKPWLHE